MKSVKKMGFLKSILFFILSITLNQSVLHFPVATKKYIFNPGDEVNSLNPSSNLVSDNGEFTLGFFTIPSTTISTYLGIWFTNEYQGRKIWVANRDIPIIGDGILMIDYSGSLKIVNGSGTTIFKVSDDQVSLGNKTRAMLQDSGNFLVYDVTSDKNWTLWQSFDHPADTLLPGMKIGYNLTTKQNWTLSSWFSDQIPATGAFTLMLEQYQNSPHLIIYRHGEIYWASNPLDKEPNQMTQSDSFFSNISRFSFEYNMSVISDASGMYFTFHTILSGLSTLQLSPTGEIIEFIDGGSNGLTPDFCYGYQTLTGCAISSILTSCRKDSDTYYLESGDWIGGLSNYEDNSSIGLTDCMERCWKDCNCKGFMTNSKGTGCRTWSGDQAFIYDGSGNALQKYVLKSQKSHISIGYGLVVLLTAQIFILIVIFTALSCCCCVIIRRRRLKVKRRRRMDEFINQLTRSDTFNYGDELERGIRDAPDIKIFSLKAVLAATDNFSDENKLGQGGYGPVYKGKLFDGREIAIKRLSNTSGQGIEEFKSELILISKVQHTNLVRLYGCCIHQGEKMLIYEFMPNKSLDFFLFDVDKKDKINWQMRIQIIEGVAQGLIYLHKYSRTKVIHRDLKVSNVLLDGNMNPKIADFGMARIFNQNVTEGSTNRVVGTYGYMAPEYAMEGTFSIKSDVFSFGVLVLEIVSGKKNSSFYNLDRPLNLVGHAWELWKAEAALELMDEALGESCDVNQLLRTIHVGLLCVQEDAEDRPTMSEVIFMLSNETADLTNPKEPAFFTGRQRVETSSSRRIPTSKVSLTFSTMGAR